MKIKVYYWQQLFSKHIALFLGSVASILAVISTYFVYKNSWILTYGDAESHLNIAKRVVDSITPGIAQLGGIWLPIPHLLMVPFVFFEPLYRTGLAGSIVSGIAFVISTVYVYKLCFLLTREKIASVVAALIFLANPNILYLQTTPMTELVLIAFLLLSSYYFILFLESDQRILYLIYAAFFGFFASLSRYEGWFLVVVQAGILVLYYLKKRNFTKLQGMVVLFSTAAFFGILLWFLWDFLILGDPMYFTNSQFSAKSQQQAWLAKGALASYHDIFSSVLYYLVTVIANTGSLIFILSAIGLFLFFVFGKYKNKDLIILLLSVPFIFYVLTLFMGQSVIFIPSLTPMTQEWTLFNVRYGVVLLPAIAVFCGYLFYKSPTVLKSLVLAVFFLQTAFFVTHAVSIISFEDGTEGLSHAKQPDAEGWMKNNYTGGLVLLDDYARTISIVRSGLPMKDVIYVGNHPYWEESLKEPEKYARWIVMQKDDDVWKHVYENKAIQAKLYKYFKKAYTSKEILIFVRNTTQLTKK